VTTIESRDRWAYGLVVIDAVALLLWPPLMAFDTFALIRPLWLAPPAVLLLLGSLGFLTRARAERQERHQRPLVLLKWTSVLVLMPLFYYAGIALLLAGSSGF